MGLRPGLDGFGKSRPTGIRCPDRPTRSESPCRLVHKLTVSILNRAFSILRKIRIHPSRTALKMEAASSSEALYLYISPYGVIFRKVIIFIRKVARNSDPETVTLLIILSKSQNQ